MKVKLEDGREIGVFVTHVAPQFYMEDGPWVDNPENDQECIRPFTSACVVVDGKEYRSKASCHKNDQFVRRKGLSIALGRALKESGLPRKDRTAVWGKVFNRKGGVA